MPKSFDEYWKIRSRTRPKLSLKKRYVLYQNVKSKKTGSYIGMANTLEYCRNIQKQSGGTIYKICTIKSA